MSDPAFFAKALMSNSAVTAHIPFEPCAYDALMQERLVVEVRLASESLRVVSGERCVPVVLSGPDAVLHSLHQGVHRRGCSPKGDAIDL